MENQKAGGLNSVGREEEWQEETGRELFGNCRNINIDDSSSFAVNTCCGGFWGIHRERLLRQFCYFLSSSWSAARDRRSPTGHGS